MIIFIFPAYLFRGLPLGELSQALLPRPDAGVDDLEEQLARPRVEDEDSPVDGLGRQVTLERLHKKKNTQTRTHGGSAEYMVETKNNQAICGIPC